MGHSWTKHLILLAAILISICFASASFADGKKVNPSHTHRIDSLLEKSRVEQWNSIPKAYATAKLALEQSIQSKNLSKEIESICMMAFMDARTNKCRSALHSLNSYIGRVESNADSLGLARIHSAMGSCYYYIGKADSAKYYIEKAVAYYKKTDNKKLLYPELNNLARACIQAGETKNAGNYNEQARAGFEQTTDPDNALLAMDTWADIMQAQRLYEKALEKNKENFSTFSKRNNLYGMAITALHIGSSYYMLMEDDSSMHYYKTSLTHFTNIGDINGMAFTNSNLSRVLLELGDLNTSIEYANKTLDLIKGGDYKRTEAATLQQLGDIYAELEQYPKAISSLEKSLAIATEIEHKNLIMDSYKSLSEINETIGKSSLAYSYLLKAYRLKDELQPIAFTKQLAEVQDKYESEQKESQLKYLEQSDRIKTLELNEKSDVIRTRNIILLAMLAIIILSGFVFYYADQRKKLRNALEREITILTTQENERMRFAKDLHDDMGSELSKINFLSELITKSQHEIPEIKKNAGTISDTTRNLVENMRDLIWALNPENSTLFNLVSRIREFSSDYMEDHPAELILIFPDHVASLEITHEGQREILMTIKECLNNIVKHAEACKVEMQCMINDELFEISICDNGKGMSDIHVNKGNGLKNMQYRVESLGGKYEIDSKPEMGTKIKISVPICILAKNRILHM